MGRLLAPNSRYPRLSTWPPLSNFDPPLHSYIQANGKNSGDEDRSDKHTGGWNFLFSMATPDGAKKLKTSNYLWYVEPLAVLLSSFGKISHSHAVILGEALALEENDLVFPSESSLARL
ncbi:PREDICTED: uncharacterized protein LOC104600464 [Nelumbo nucifera]|uniref:Uncharacterized protein LOC104600464 n=1 Tax=Nelumbo nucifera TaxID=4432 RepID=A0A1U8A5I4_NELNU|nr:PREDICTED: uncharacterized protein LOC104600464 [Nelumbo nucifera]